MIININNQYRVTTDPHNFIMQIRKGDRLNKETGEMEESWQNLTFHPDLANLIKSLLSRELRDPAHETLTEALEAQKVLMSEVSQAFAPFYRVTVEKL